MAAPLLRSQTLTLDLPDVAATAALARALAARARAGDVITLSGDLGTGKTTFARAFIGALPGPEAGAAEEVPSPTFTLVQVYERAPAPVWHFDLYRIKNPAEVFELGFEDALADGIVLIEWPDRLGPLLPRVRLDLHLGLADESSAGPAGDPGARRATLSGHGDWAERLGGLHDLA